MSKQFLTVSKRNTDRFTPEDFAAQSGREAERARALYMEGFIRQIWHRAEGNGACLLVEADSREEVEQKLASLPMVAKGMLTVEQIIELAPYKGFGNAL
ncbi:muconolactone Delta-isomerase family protein [Oecophyllibacter saccharovorans]|uniref:Muconolactone isomerase domain-containing protein n=2 Tax=Oecophyllibacter saccharovorans TaxID=2558360 RepID=A0A506UKK5_9PROT|nr:muconolactone Delta-isomerase family protein [Oecophyllibacter saccharovorans]QDH15960.1 hypothetical protein E3E11_03005 [Oecophyllibacter saccharovorans]TPW33845.1 hypothetical protein E3202_04405 [Oecophyllibacter saccharovorans]TPW35188.1 hypothetical protein E3203_06920 [Oecophyllibacter saccharovorans]